MQDKIISIVADNGKIYGLDDKGDVWVRVPGGYKENAKWIFWQG